jgi:hypothetical protein
MMLVFFLLEYISNRSIMNNKYLLAKIFVAGLMVSGHSQSWSWALNGYGQGSNRGQAIATDQHGAVYTVVRGGSEGFGHNCFNEGNTLLKCDSTGNVLWSRTFTTYPFLPDPKGVCVDLHGNCYIAGGFGGTLIFCGGANTDTVIYSSGSFDGFLAKYDTQGNLKWARRYGYSVSSDYIRALKNDPQGNVYVTGNSAYYSNAVLYNEDFLGKYNTAGNVTWLKTSNWKGNATPVAMDVDGAGNCYVTGSFGDSAFFGNTVLVANATNWIVFLAKYDASGNLIFAKKSGVTPALSEAWSISLDHNGYFYFTGRYISPAVFDTYTLTGGGTYGTGGMFIARCDTSGTISWVKNSDAMRGNSVQADMYGNALVCGRFYLNPSVFGSGTNTVALTNTRSNGELFLAKYNASSNLEWVLKPGGHGLKENWVSAVTADKFNNCYITGSYGDTTIFGSQQLLVAEDNFFVAKLNLRPANLTGLSDRDNQLSLTLFPNPNNGNFYLRVNEALTGALITVKVFSSTGQMLYQQKYKNGNGISEIELSMPGAGKGICFVVVEDGQKRFTGPVAFY